MKSSAVQRKTAAKEKIVAQNDYGWYYVWLDKRT